MNILVALKPIIDPARPPTFFSGPPLPPDFDRAVEQTLLNPFDEIALEAAIRFQEAGLATQVTVVTVGPLAWEAFLRTALAMGADRALRVEAPPDLEPLSVAKRLATIATEENATLLLTGRQAMDTDHNQTGQMTAALLQWGQVTHAIQIVLQPEAALVLREGENGMERWRVSLPAVITVDWRLNGIHETGGPRYASLPNIMKARRKPLERIPADRWAMTLPPHTTSLSCQPPPLRPPGQRFQAVSPLLEALREVLPRQPERSPR